MYAARRMAKAMAIFAFRLSFGPNSRSSFQQQWHVLQMQQQSMIGQQMKRKMQQSKESKSATKVG